jgi:hypothetical protein
VYVLDGKVESIVVSTSEQSGQDAAYEALKRKFGKPAKLAKPLLQNTFGAKYEGLDAKWTIGDVTVEFSGTDGDIEHGQIDVSSKKFVDVYSRWKVSNTHNDL